MSKMYKNLNLDFYYNEDEKCYKVVAFWNSGTIIKEQIISEDQLQEMIDRKSNIIKE